MAMPPKRKADGSEAAPQQASRKPAVAKVVSIDSVFTIWNFRWD
jgi:hypothetical protein